MKARYRIEVYDDDEFVVDTETGVTLSPRDLVEKLNEQEVSLELLSALEATTTERIKEFEKEKATAIKTFREKTIRALTPLMDSLGDKTISEVIDVIKEVG